MPAFSNGSYHHFCSLLMQMQYVGETYHKSIPYANFWFDMAQSKDLFQPWTRLVHENFRQVPLDTKVFILGSLPSTLRDHLARWALICRPIYPRTRLNQRNEPERSASVVTVRTKRNETMSVWRNRWMAEGQCNTQILQIQPNKSAFWNLIRIWIKTVLFDSYLNSKANIWFGFIWKYLFAS